MRSEGQVKTEDPDARINFEHVSVNSGASSDDDKSITSKKQAYDSGEGSNELLQNRDISQTSGTSDYIHPEIGGDSHT